MFELREYQERQKSFIESNLRTKVAPFPMFDRNIAIESPTGSGKTVMMLSFIKDYLERNEGASLFISTGFNNLVFQMEKMANEMGIPNSVLIGRSNANCVKKINAQLPEDRKVLVYNNERFYRDTEADIGVPVFTEDAQYRCKYSECVECKNRYGTGCIYSEHVANTFYDYSSRLIITNHSTFLYNKDMFIQRCNGGFIDECQAFADFYEGYLSVDVTPANLRTLVKDAESNGIDRKLMKDGSKNQLVEMVKYGMTNGQLTKETMRRFLDIELEGKDASGQQQTIRTKHKRICDGIVRWIEAEDEDDNYIHPLFEDDEFNGIKIDYFFNDVDIPQGMVCLVSATVDDYTKKLFKVGNEYREEGCNLFDYTKSSFYIYPDFDRNSLTSFLEEQEGDRGLLLSTRLSVVDDAREAKSMCGYEFIFDSNDFVDGKKQILVGSKSIFQGIDLPDVDFVAINKIPFPRYDESYKKKQRYIQNTTGVNSFSGYTIPYTENQLIQAMGRLWRKPGDSGNVAVFDRRLAEKHGQILDYVSRYRYGICVKNRLYCR